MSGTCRSCGAHDLTTVLDLGAVPAADAFPSADSAPDPEENRHPLAMALCGTCSLAQLLDDDTLADEPRGVEPEALRLEAEAAIAAIERRGWLTEGTVVREYGSPHGGTWIPAIAARGVRDAAAVSEAPDVPADLIVDGFGLMHEPDQAAALRERAERLSASGVLALQVHSLATIVEQRQWTALRHGHFAYWSLTALERALRSAGLAPMGCWESALYGGTLLVLARRADGAPAESEYTAVDLTTATAVRAREAALGVTEASVVSTLGAAATAEVAELRRALADAAGEVLAAYGAASRAVALFAMAGVDRTALRAVVDASPAKWGRRMPGTDVPIVAPEWMYTHRPDRVLVTVPDLVDEVSRAHPTMTFTALDTLSATGPTAKA